MNDDGNDYQGPYSYDDDPNIIKDQQDHVKKNTNHPFARNVIITVFARNVIITVLGILIVIGIILAIALSSHDEEPKDNSSYQSSSLSSTEDNYPVKGAPENVTITSIDHRMYEGKSVIIVTYHWKNTNDHEGTFSRLFRKNAFQNGKSLDENYDAEIDFGRGDPSFEYYSGRAIKPGIEDNVKVVFNLVDNSDVTIEVYSNDDYDIKHPVEKVFKIDE